MASREIAAKRAIRGYIGKRKRSSLCGCEKKISIHKATERDIKSTGRKRCQ